MAVGRDGKWRIPGGGFFTFESERARPRPQPGVYTSVSIRFEWKKMTVHKNPGWWGTVAYTVVTCQSNLIRLVIVLIAPRVEGKAEDDFVRADRGRGESVWSSF